jgi:two-component system, sensor histidine kinase and response regulator
VLIVDDVRANSLALEVQLQGLDCTTLCADSGSSALSLLLRESFAVMLLDVRMPGMDGYEVARHVRMHAATRQLPIIFMTAASPDASDDLRLGYDAGAVDFLFKPINRQILRSKVRVFLELYCSRLELAEANQRLEQANARLLGLVDAEAAAARALRQANDDLGIAYRGLREARSQLMHTASAALTPDASGELVDGDRPTDFD